MNTAHDDAMNPRQNGNLKLVFTGYLRMLASLFLLYGLANWGVVIGLADSNGVNFAHMTTETQIATAFFAVADLVAATGLWLLSSWGVVVWVIALGLDILSHTYYAHIFGENVVSVIFNVLSLLVYLGMADTKRTSRIDAEL